MKTPYRILPILAALLCGQGLAQEVRTPPASTVAVIPAPVLDEIPAEPPAPAVKPDFRVESTQAKRLYVVEAPPMPGLPPVEGTITLTVQSVADPGLPDPPPPAAAVISEDVEPHGRVIEKQLESRFSFVSATVYDRSRTRITCYSNGGYGGAVTAWSNIDFNHMAGLGDFQATRADGMVRSYYFMMGIGNVSTSWGRETEDGDYEAPVIPALLDGVPAFVIETENPDPETVGVIEDLHALYRTEGDRLAMETAAREKAYAEKKAYYLANPPKPKDVTVRFWKREKPAANPEGVRP